MATFRQFDMTMEDLQLLGNRECTVDFGKSSKYSYLATTTVAKAITRIEQLTNSYTNLKEYHCSNNGTQIKMLSPTVNGGRYRITIN